MNHIWEVDKYTDKVAKNNKAGLELTLVVSKVKIISLMDISIEISELHFH